MAFSEIITLSDPPQRDQDEETFAPRADVFLVELQQFSEDLNTFKTELETAAALIAAAPAYADAGLVSIAGISIGANEILYGTGTDTFATQTLTPFARTLIDDGDAATARTTLGLGTMATQAASGIAVTGGSITGITDLAVADGGTGASTASAARTNLGLDALVCPSGAVMAFAMNSPPTGWLECDGSAVSRTTYAALFAAIGTTFGVGDGSTTFNLPDLRGEFVRGWDNGRGVDSGRSFGSWQDHELEAHTHTINYGSSGASTYSADPDDGNLQAQSGSTGGDETRPRNVALLYAVKT